MSVHVFPYNGSGIVGENVGYPDGMINGTLTASVAANALTIAIKTLAGADPSAADPVYVIFRNATQATGDYTLITLTAATSIVVSSGSTLGTVSSLAFRVWVVGFNDAGTFRLGVINCSNIPNTSAPAGTIYPLVEGIPQSSTAEGGAGAADSAGTFYTGTAVTTKALRILGYMDWGSGLVTAGTWASGPTAIQLFGPGIRLPGAVVQTVSVISSTETTTTNLAASPAVTTLTVNITPSAAANLIKVQGTGGLQSSNVNSSANARLYRGGTQALGNAIQLYPNNFYGSGLMMQGFDKPNTTASTTYAAYVWSSAGDAVDFLSDGVGGQTGYLIVEEIMG